MLPYTKNLHPGIELLVFSASVSPMFFFWFLDDDFLCLIGCGKERGGNDVQRQEKRGRWRCHEYTLKNMCQNFDYITTDLIYHTAEMRGVHLHNEGIDWDLGGVFLIFAVDINVCCLAGKRNVIMLINKINLLLLSRTAFARWTRRGTPTTSPATPATSSSRLRPGTTSIRGGHSASHATRTRPSQSARGAQSP